MKVYLLSSLLQEPVELVAPLNPEAPVGLEFPRKVAEKVKALMEAEKMAADIEKKNQ